MSTAVPKKDADPLLSIDNLSVGYAGRPLLPGISAALLRGQCWAVWGRNGSGKTTLLRTVLGLQPALGGSLQRRRDVWVSHVPQRGDHDLSVPTRVVDFVRGGLDSGWSFLRPGHTRAFPGRLTRAMADTHVAPLAREQLRSLSEGQKQRVLLARALVSDPQVLVLDEPTSAMDTLAERRLFTLLDALRAARGLAVLMASHNIALSARHASHAIFLDRDDGLALCATVAHVVRTQAFVSRYGDVLADVPARDPGGRSGAFVNTPPRRSML